MKLTGNIRIFIPEKSYFLRILNTQQIFPLGIEPVIVALYDVISVKVFLVILGAFAKLKPDLSLFANWGPSCYIRKVVIAGKVIVGESLDQFNFADATREINLVNRHHVGQTKRHVEALIFELISLGIVEVNMNGLELCITVSNQILHFKGGVTRCE